MAEMPGKTFPNEPGATLSTYRPWLPTLPIASPLTDRELDVLEAAARGMNKAAIARHLGLSEGTVKTHRGNIGRKLGVHTTAAAVAYGMRTGLIR